jgi:exonuclease III
VKSYYLKDVLEKNRIDICFIQETHLRDKEEIKNFESIFCDYDHHFTLNISKTRGVGIVVKKNTDVVISTIDFDFENRIIGCEIKIQGQVLNFVNIYAPNTSDEQCEFIEYLYDFLNTKKRILLVGDFNFVEDSKFDRITTTQSGKINNKKIIKKNVRVWNSFFVNFSIQEIQWYEKDNDRIMTWSNGHYESRIDRMYVKDDFPFEIQYCENINFIMSDHRMVVAEIKTNFLKTSTKKTHWKLNESVLNSHTVCRRMRKLCNGIPGMG